MEDDGPPRKRLQSDPPPSGSRVVELEKELVDADKKIAEQGATIRELTISLEAARRESEFKDSIINDKERIISEKQSIINEKQLLITAQKEASENAANLRILTAEAQKEASENAANLRILTAEKQFRDRANQKVKEKAEEANRLLKERAEEANRLLDDAHRREKLLRQDLVHANQRVVQANRRLDEAYQRENILIRELSKAQSLHMETKREGKVMFGFLKTGMAAFERLAETKCAIADRHEDKVPHLKTVGKLLGDESTTPYGVQVAREDPESQHLSGHRYAMIEGSEASINERCATPIGTFIPTVDPDSEHLRFQNSCEGLMERHTHVPSGLVFNLSWYAPYLEWTDATPGNLFEKEDVERALRNLSLTTEDNAVSTLTNSVKELAIAVPQDKKELQSETTKIRSRLNPITSWMKENEARINQPEPIKRRLTMAW